MQHGDIKKNPDVYIDTGDAETSRDTDINKTKMSIEKLQVGQKDSEDVCSICNVIFVVSLSFRNT